MPMIGSGAPTGPAQMSAYRPTLQDRAQAWIADHLPIGDNYMRQELAHRITDGPLSPLNLTPVGAMFAADQAGRQIASGHPIAGGAGLAMAAIPVPGVVRAGKGMIGAVGRKTVAAALPEVEGAIGALTHADSPLMISTRRPSPAGARVYGDPDRQLLTQSGAAMAFTPENFAKNAAQLKELPMMAGSRVRNPQAIADQFTRRGADNLKFIVNDLMDPAKVDAARHWYPTANQVLGNSAERAGLPREAGYGIGAVTSPQSPWDVNVAKAVRLMGMHSDGWQGGSSEPQRAVSWVNSRLAGKAPGAVAKLGPEYAARVMATPMEELEHPFDRYAKTVLTDAVRNNPSVPYVGLDGGFHGHYGNITWGSSSEVNKALNIAQDPSIESISAQMQGGGKVPSFYNNIAAPHSDAGISTIDTHSAGAANLFPGGGGDPMVYRAMGLGPPTGAVDPLPAASDSGTTGAKGHYGWYADAHQLAGDELGMLPREVQSATWEGVRDLWGQSGKTPQLKADINNIWRSSPDDDAARAAIAERLGKALPTVYGPGS